jgi:hypothetical protein
VSRAPVGLAEMAGTVDRRLLLESRRYSRLWEAAAAEARERRDGDANFRDRAASS